jgi:tol-pal system protein YbgF
MRKAAFLYATILFVVLFQGCSYITVLRTQELYAVRDSLRAEIDSLRSKLLEEQQAQEDLLRLIRADQQVRFSELEKQVADVGSGLSENQYRLSKIDEKTADFQRQLESKLAADSLSVNSRSAEIVKLFQAATGDFNAGRFDIAKKSFRDLSSRFPESSQGQEAEYWVGECLYAKKEYKEAETALLLYIKKYPQGNKACVTLYKLGLCYEKLDKDKSKDLVWKKLLDKCPDTQEAEIVKSRME